MTIRRTYVDTSHGQIHARLTPPVPGAVPLVCLHATAYSSQSFLPLMAVMGQYRQIIAIDAPGYGESDALTGSPDMAAYARQVMNAVVALTDVPVAVLGYHTGGYIGAEMSITRPDLIQRLVLIGIPYFQALDFDHWKAKLAAQHRLGEALDQFSERWDYFVTQRHPGITLQRGFANFVDELKAWPDGWKAHEAMFTYPSAERLPLIDAPVLVLNPSGHLAVPSRTAAAMIPYCTIADRPDLSGPILELWPDVVAAAIESWWTAVPDVQNVQRSKR